MLFVLACAEPAPPASGPPAEAPARTDTLTDTDFDTTDTYIEGSERVWNEARARGVAFRAVGQEPGWVLEIERTGGLLLLTGYGQDTARASLSAGDVARTAGAAAIAASTDAGGEVRIDIRTEPCTDTMSGERFSRSVTVTLNGTAYAGCGRALDPVP